MTPEEIWENKWKDILTDPDGSINLEKLKLELADFEALIGRMAHLTYEITDGLLSYPTYTVEAILDAKERVEARDMEIHKRIDREEGICSFCEREFNDKRRSR